MNGGIYEGPHGEQLHGDGREVTPPGVESGSGQECAARKALQEIADSKPTEYEQTAYQDETMILRAVRMAMLARAALARPCPAPQLEPKLIDNPYPRESDEWYAWDKGWKARHWKEVREEAAPRPSLTREQAEKMAQEVFDKWWTGEHSHWTALRKGIAAALQAVAGSEDTLLLDGLSKLLSVATSVSIERYRASECRGDEISVNGHAGGKTLRDALRAAIGSEERK